MLLTTTALSTLLMLGSAPQSCSASKAAASANAEPTIVETALGNEAFSTLVTALKAADLVEALQGEGPFTVFAPTNAAFAQIPADQLAMLLKPENKGLLQSILTYHVVPANLPAKEVLTSKFATTLNGQRIAFSTTDGGVAVDGAAISATDIHCANGVIHVIDSVIMPSTADIVATAVEAGSFKTLAAALSAAHLVETLQGKGPFTVFAPTDEAFAALPAGTLEHLLEPANRAQLSAILTLHVVPGRIYSDAVLAGRELKTVQGQVLEASLHGERAMVNGAAIVKADIQATNGVIHVIDTVLLPE